MLSADDEIGSVNTTVRELLQAQTQNPESYTRTKP